ADREDRALDCDQPRQRGVLRTDPTDARQRDHRQADSGDRDPGPLPPLQAKAEEPLRQDSQEDEPAGENGLGDRQWCERKRPDVKQPCRERNDPADRKPARMEEPAGAAQWMTDAYRWRGHRSPSLEQK